MSSEEVATTSRGSDKNQSKNDSSGICEPPDWPAPEIDVTERSQRRLLHWGPMIALGIIAFIGFTTTHYMMMWWPLTSLSGITHFMIYLFWSIMTVDNLVKASSYGPGYVPKGWKPHEKWMEDKLQQCKPCEGFKAPRSHHCSKCKRCSMKMDHHCPWINNCVGHVNHAYFMRFLASAIVGCIHSTIVLCFCIYHAFNLHWYIRYGDGSEPRVEFDIVDLFLVVIASAAAVAVAIALAVLLGFQVKYVVRNKNSIEEYIYAKAVNRREDGTTWNYPYNVGWRRNIFEVLCSLSGNVSGNGFWWPVTEGCDQFTFTMEQLEQKALKKQFSRNICITKDYNGGRLEVCRYKVKYFFTQPIVDGAPMKVTQGEQMVATRAASGWIYCYRAANEQEKGWVPREVTNLLTAREALPYRDQLEEKEQKIMDEMIANEDKKKN